MSEEERAAILSTIAREIRYRDTLHKLRADLERLQGLVTLSGRQRVANEMFATIDYGLDTGDFGPLPEPAFDEDRDA